MVSPLAKTNIKRYGGRDGWEDGEEWGFKRGGRGRRERGKGAEEGGEAERGGSSLELPS